MTLRIAIFGQAPFGRDVTDRLASAGHEVVGVHVPPDAGSRVDPLAGLATEQGWPLFRYKGYRRKGEAIRERVDEFLALGAELCVLPFTTVILPPEIVNGPKHRSVCFHPSILPAYRGGAALAWQIIEGETESGISVFQPDEGVDTGPLYHQERGVPISESDNMASLYFDKLYPRGVEAMVSVVDAIDRGKAVLEPQRTEGASFQGLVDDAAARLNFSLPVADVGRRIRGCDPAPGAWAERGEERVRLYGASIERGENGSAAPGVVLSCDEDGLLLAARGGCLRIQKVLRGDGGKKGPAAGSGLERGDRLI